jgi:murein DD-endopeptidase MepM/ murein hydrolase activator NlpD
LDTSKGEAEAFDELFARIILQEVGKSLSKGSSAFGGQQAQAFQGVWMDALAGKIAEAGPGLGAAWLEGQQGMAAAPVQLNLVEPLASRPSKGRAMRVSSAYGWRTDPITGARSKHNGIDMAAVRGTEIPAIKAGTVRFAGERGGYGNVVILDHGDGLETRYAHCQDLLVQAGDVVQQGQTVATVGSTGRSTGPHLHFEARQDGEAIDPGNLVEENSKHLLGRSDALVDRSDIHR